MNITFTSDGDCHILDATIGVIVLDEAGATKQFLIFDIGRYTFQDEETTTAKGIDNFDVPCFVGLTAFYQNQDIGDIYFNVDHDGTFEVNAEEGFYEAEFNYFCTSQFSCPANTFYEFDSKQCVSQCSGLAVDVDPPHCSLCKYSCGDCDYADTETCTACTEQSYRTQNGADCDCNPGFVDFGEYRCTACPQFACTTCDTDLVCSACNVTLRRFIQNGECVAFPGCISLHNLPNVGYKCLACDSTKGFEVT